MTGEVITTLEDRVQLEFLYPDINFSAVVLCSLKESPLTIKGLVTSDYEGPDEFNHALFDFGQTFVNYQNSTIPEEIRRKENNGNLQILSLTHPEVAEALNNLIKVVEETGEEGLPNQTLKGEYKKNIAVVAKTIESARNLPKADIVLVPLKGGALLLPYLGMQPEDINAIDCKRLPLTKGWGNFGLGMRTIMNGYKFKGGYQAEQINGMHVRIIEVAVVTGMTTVAMLLDFQRQGIKPSLVEVNAIGMSQQGIELINAIAEKLGYKEGEIKFITGGLYYKTGDSYQHRGDEILTEEGKQVLGHASLYLNYS